MRIIANREFIARREQVGQWVPLVALVLLFGGLALSWIHPQEYLLSTGIILLGFILSILASYLTEHYSGDIVPHKRLPAALKGMTNDYVLLIHHKPVPFLLIEPGGITVIHTKGQANLVLYDGQRWHHVEKWHFFKQLGGQEPLGDPIRQANDLIKQVRKHLAKTMPDAAEIPVRAVIVFINPEVRLEMAEEPPLPTLPLPKLKRWLRNNPLHPTLPAEQRQALAQALGIETEGN